VDREPGADATLAAVSVPTNPFGEEPRERLVEASRLAAVGRLVPSLLHQLSTPLASISLRGEGLQRFWSDAGPEAAAKAARYLEAIAVDAGALRELLSLVRDFARPVLAEPEDVDVGELCREAAQLVLHEAMRRQVEVRPYPAEGLPALRGHAGRLRQAVLALVLNALDASPAGGRIDVRTRAEGGEIVVDVDDAGPGIAPENEARLGEPFFSTRPGGLGLGLMSCRAIAGAHGGSLAWGSGAAGGARFTLRLPWAHPGPEKRA
jgi:signal transduction histidine kinase